MQDVGYAFGNWFAGFTAGEGCFLIIRSRDHYSCRLVIELRADELATLEDITERLGGIGRIQHLAHRGSAGANPLCRWAVGSRPGCQEIVRLFDKYPLRARKAEDFAIWRQAVEAWTIQDFGHMAYLKEHLNASRGYDARMSA